MALLLCRVGALLGVVAWSLATDDSVVWYSGTKQVTIPCVLPNADRIKLRPPQPLIDDKSKKSPYTWKLNGVNLNTRRISPNGTLRHNAEGTYQCQVRSNEGTILGYPKTAKIIDTNTWFSENPQNVNAVEGQPAYMRCQISSSQGLIPNVNYTWTRNNKNVTTDDRTYVLENLLIITEVTVRDKGTYRCIARNKFMTINMTSDSAKLTVSTQKKDIEPAFLLEHTWDEVYGVIGGTVLMPCLLSGYPTPEIMWEFYPSSGDRPMELDAVIQVLERSQLSIDQEGIYTCKVIGKEHLKRSFNLQILEDVRITNPPESRDSMKASTARFNCSAYGKPEPTIEWFKNGHKVEFVGRVRLLPSPDNKDIQQLVINSVTIEDAGVYQCFAKNNHSISSEWATLSVSGSHMPAPYNVTCIPVDSKHVKIKWKYSTENPVVAYTVHYSLPDGPSLPLAPVQTKSHTISLERPLTPYTFQVRGYFRNIAGDFSEAITCQTQEVPLHVAKNHAGNVTVSWNRFAREVPDVKFWKIQFWPEDTTNNNITQMLSPNITKYVLPHASYNGIKIKSVRVLGSTSSDNANQNDQPHVKWTSIDVANTVPATPSLKLSWVTPHSVYLHWEPIAGASLYKVCLSNNTNDGTKPRCTQTELSNVEINNLNPNTGYEAVIKTEDGQWSVPLVFFTAKNVLEDKSHQLIKVNYTYIDDTTIKIFWKVDPSINSTSYKVHYSPVLKLPVRQWNYKDVQGYSVLLTGLSPYNKTYVMVTNGALNNNKIETIPEQREKNKITWTYNGGSLALHKSGIFSTDECKVAWSQQLLDPMDFWHKITFKSDVIELPIEDVSKSTYISVICGDDTIVDTIPPTTEKPPTLYIGIVVGCSICLLVFVIIGIVLCIRWKKKPRARRRQPTSGNEEDGAELKCMDSRLANGGGVGQPLLNGHVHITENPAQAKAPNGKLLKVTYADAFDLSRVDDPDQTMETTIDSTNSILENTQNLDSYILPDSNMNSEITQFGATSKTQPVLQPNG